MAVSDAEPSPTHSIVEAHCKNWCGDGMIPEMQSNSIHFVRLRKLPPRGAIRINPIVSRLSRDGQVTWFLGADHYFSHPADDSAGQRLALATLMTNGHARPSQIQKSLVTSPRSLARWCKQLDA